MSRGRRYAIAIVVAAGVIGLWCGVHARRARDGGSTAAGRDEHRPSVAWANAKPPAAVHGGRRIAGEVTFGGAPVVGASVRLAGRADLAAARTATDASGRFDLGPQALGAYVVIAEMPGRTGAAVSIDLRDPTSQPDQLHLVLHACDASLHGTVHDTAGGVVARARIEVPADDADAGLATDADDSGNYELCLPLGSQRVIARADGYARHEDDLAVYGRLRQDFLLSPEADVHGRVVRASDRTPVANAALVLESEDSRRRDLGVLYASSRDDGTFHFEGASPGRYVILATAERLATAQPVEVIAEIGGGRDVECALVATLEVSGKLVEHGSGKPVAGMSVVLMAPGRYERSLQLAATTQADGRFVIDHVLPGEYMPIVSSTQLSGEPKRLTIGAADVSGVTIEIEPSGSISGRITRGGKPVDGADVNSRGVAVKSDHEGRYTLRGLGAGKYTIYAESKRDGAFTPGPTITLAAGEQKTGVDIEVDLAGSISGVVVDQTGAPVSGAFVRFSLVHGRDYGLATTADDGTFSARGLAGGGDYVYDVERAEYSPLKYPPLHGRRFPAIAVKDGQSHVTGVRIEIRREQLAIAGHVVDAAGAAVPDVTVELTPIEQTYFTASSATTDVHGAFALHDLAPGSYALHARGARGEQHAVAAAGRSDVVLQLAAVGSIEGTLEGFTDVPAVSASGESSWAGYSGSVSANAFAIRDVPAGKYYVQARSPSGLASATAEVAPGGVAKVVLRQRGYGRIEGTIIDAATHAPADAMYCRARSDDGGDSPNSYGRCNNGAYQIDHALAGKNEVVCSSEDVRATTVVEVIAGQTVRQDLVARSIERPTRGDAGLTLEDQLGEVVVESVAPGGPAARAGIAPGDVVVRANDVPMQAEYGPEVIEAVLAKPPGTQVKLGLERGDTQLTATITLASPP